MISKFISNKSQEIVKMEYSFDDNVRIDDMDYIIDGNLKYKNIECLKNTKDIKINNYTLNILSNKNELSNIIKYNEENNIDNKLCYVYSNSSVNIDENAIFWKIRENTIKIEDSYSNLDKTNLFIIDFLDENTCKIYHDKYNIRYLLSHSIALSSLKTIPLTAENIESYATIFNYISNGKSIFFYVQEEFGNFLIKKKNKNLYISYASKFEKEDAFFLKKQKDLEKIKNTVNWVSYKNTFNKNNLNINEEKSHFNVQNNYLFSTTLHSIISSLPVNLMALKNQLNQENDQSRGNVFLNENETNLKEYESIFTGGWREFGYDKINLGYTSYTTPFTFKSGKTTYFHVPHEIYPYAKLNVNSSKLAESGAVGGNCPLNSDKIWKKLKNYRETSTYSHPQEENTGQWLCTWLSAGNIGTRPIWVDRYYNPSKITPYSALSASPTDIIYKDSFNCLDLKNEISDVKSSLTFEKGSYYAYMHLGKSDYENIIKESFGTKILYEKLNSYRKTNFFELESFGNEYVFNGTQYGYIDSFKEFENNVASFSFFLEKDDWDIPNGNLIFGNYINKGFGFYNYILNTPYFILKENKNTLSLLNNNLVYIDNISTENLTLCSIVGISRRGGFENIHAFTEDFKIIEFDLKGTIVNSNSAICEILNLKPEDKIYSITNDEYYSYVSTSSGIAEVDLNSNNVKIVYQKAEIGINGENHDIIIDSDRNIYKVYGQQPIIRGTNIFFLSGNVIKSYSTTLSSISNYTETPSSIDCFCISKEGDVDIVTNNSYIIYKNNELFKTIQLNLSANSLSAKQFCYSEKFEYGELKKYKNIYCENQSESYIIRYNENYEQSLIKLDKKYDIVQNNLDITNYNYNIQYIVEKYKEKSYHFKVKLVNKLNLKDFTEILFIIDSKDLSIGYRHFVFSIDCYKGVADFYLDGQLYKSINFTPKKYILSNNFNERIFYGSNGYFNGVPAFKYFKDDTDFVCKNFNLKENYILNKSLDAKEVMCFYSKIYPPKDIVYNMPSSTRSFIDSMEKFFNFNIPMFKSTKFKLNIFNTGIISESLRSELENEISKKIKDYLPYYTELQGFEWIDTIVKPIKLEGDYNISNTLTNII